MLQHFCSFHSHLQDPGHLLLINENGSFRWAQGGKGYLAVSVRWVRAVSGWTCESLWFCRIDGKICWNVMLGRAWHSVGLAMDWGRVNFNLGILINYWLTGNAFRHWSDACVLLPVVWAWNTGHLVWLALVQWEVKKSFAFLGKNFLFIEVVVVTWDLSVLCSVRKGILRLMAVWFQEYDAILSEHWDLFHWRSRRCGWGPTALEKVLSWCMSRCHITKVLIESFPFHLMLVIHVSAVCSLNFVAIVVIWDHPRCLANRLEDFESGCESIVRVILVWLHLEIERSDFI